MDAISFVLGLQSNSLRSTNAKDLIYRGRVPGSDKDGDDSDEEMSNSDKENYPGMRLEMPTYLLSMKAQMVNKFSSSV